MEATPEQAAEGQAIVRVLATVLERLVCSNAGLAVTDPGQVTKFHALKAPGIGILPYLERIHKYASCSNECFILALIYIDRLIQRNNFLLTELNVHRVIITAILLAAKFFDDAYYNNAYYSKVGGVLVSEMNGLEVDFLFRINFSLHVPPELFEKYKEELVAHAINSGITIPQDVIPGMQLSNDPTSMITVATTTACPPETDRINPTLLVAQAPQLAATTSAQVPVPAVQPYVQQHHHVTPSPPPHVATTTVVGNTSAGPQQEPVATTIEQSSNPLHIQPTNAIQQHPMYVADNKLFHNIGPAMSQQLQQHRHGQHMQRANSLPYPSNHSGRCLVNNNPPYSAPMISMLPNGLEEQYVVVSNQIFPLQATLVHHNHAVETSYHEHHHQTGYHAAAAAGLASLAREQQSLGSLVAGHY